MAHPFPNLTVKPTSGLTFPWSDYSPHVEGTFDMHVGPEGAGLGMVMQVYWGDLQKALQQLVGYSYRSNGRIKRKLPWQNALMNNMWVRNVVRVQGIRSEGTNFDEDPFDLEEDDSNATSEGGVGEGQISNTGPWADYNLALLTLQFWRPPYAIRSDADVVVDGSPQEWLRYVDRNWDVHTQMLSREGAYYEWTRLPTAPPDPTGYFPGSVGQPITKMKVVRRWYEVPEECLFLKLADGTPSGLPVNLLYMQTGTTNPITGYVQTFSPDNAPPIGGCVNSPRGGGTDDSDQDKRFFGCRIGTLLYEAVRIMHKPLQLPAFLMNIPAFGDNEAVSQVQYDVEFHFSWFDPPRADIVRTTYPNDRGHNLVPWAGDGLWYSIRSQNNVTGTSSRTTPFQYADFTDLFKVL